MRLHHATWLMVFACLLQAQPRPVRIGMILDGPWERNEEVRSTFEREIVELLKGEFDPQFRPEHRITADFTPQGIREAFDRLFADPEVDIIIALGPQASNQAGHREELPKPVLAPFVIRAALQEIPLTPDGTSGKDNLSYVEMGTDTVEEVRRFLEIVPFRSLAFLINQGLSEELPRGTLVAGLRAQGIDIEVITIPVRHSAEAALAAIPQRAEAAYLAPLTELGEGELRELIAGLIERKLPSFSMWGRNEVQMGVLAGLGLDLDMGRLARRVALNLQRILLGEAPSSLPVKFERRQRLTINMSTARSIQVFPNWDLMTEAELLQEKRATVERVVSLPSAAREAVAANLDLLSAERSVAAGEQRVRRVRAELFPQASASSTGALIDEDRARASFGSAGRFNLTGSVGMRQLIYSEPVRAGYDIEGHLQRTREEERNQLRLDIMEEATVAYLNVLRAKTVDEIVKSNLELTRRLLELARNRRALGAAGPDEVYRFENQIAVNRREVIDASAARNQAEIALNRVLNRPLEEPFETRDETLASPELVLNFERLRPYVGSIDAFKVFRNFMVVEAFDAAPELRRLRAGISAQERSLLAARRSFYVPEVAAQAEVAGVGRYGAGSQLSFELPEGIQFPTPGNVDWTVGFSASLPLFTSGARRSEVARAREELSGLRVDLEAIQQRIEQRIRSALHVAMASFAGINLAEAAATAARQTLDVVTDSYSRGLVDNIKLLDAQNQALQADLSAANAVYDHLSDLMMVQRSVGRFDFFLSPEEERAFLERLDTFYQKQGFPVRKPGGSNE